MKLPLLYQALCDRPHDISGNGDNIAIRCPFCGDSKNHPNEKHLSIRINVGQNEPVLYQCFRASCGVHGYLKTSDLTTFGITDMDVLMELSAHNRSINKKMDSIYKPRENRGFVVANPSTYLTRPKLEFLEKRLGKKFTQDDLVKYKIQLNLYDMLRINGIHQLAFNQNYCDVLNDACIGFVSIYEDYLILRDVTPELKTGKRYTNYRVRGTPDPNDTKIYAIPGEIDLMDPHSAVINVAEGPFSILGAYLNTDLGRNKKNHIWLANCGSAYRNTILGTCYQYGLLKVQINIWSDSEIPIGKYDSLLRSIKDHIDIRSFTVYYNDAAEDFGHQKRDIKPSKASLL